MTEPAFNGPPASEAVTKEPWWKRKWFVGVVAGLIGIGIGAASAAPAVEDSPEYKTLSGELDDAKSELSDAQAQASRVDEVDAATAANEKRSEELDKRQSGLKDTEAALVKRERAVGIKETEIANNTISGEGTYAVGQDIKPGTYKSGAAASGNCYWQISTDPNGADIINNNNSSGQSLVTVSNGQYLTLSGCDDFVKQ
jgi:hypothetical protein